MADRNCDIADDHRIRVRIGVNVGIIVTECSGLFSEHWGGAMRLHHLIVLLIGLLAGCVSPPTYKDPLDVSGQKKSAYGEIRAGLVLSDGFKVTAGTIAGNRTLYAAWGMSSSTLALETMTHRINEALSRRFVQLLRYDGIEDARRARLDWIVQLDAQASIGQMSFQTSSMTLSANVMDGAGRMIDTISGTGKHRIPYPATNSMIEHAFADALKEFLANVDGSPKLVAAVAPALARRSSRGTTVAGAPPRPEAPAVRRSYAFPSSSSQNPDAIAVVIGNEAYPHPDVPEKRFALNDAAAVQQYLLVSMGYSPRNVIVLENARQSDFLAYFGTTANEKGRLFDMVRPGRSDVFVFYSGHGIPVDGGSGYLLPVGADPGKPQLTGYSIETLVANLGKARARSVVLAIDSSFSGTSAAGALVRDASPVFLSAKLPAGMANGVVLTAAKGNQIASWDRDAKLGLFTRYLLEGLLGKADDKKRGGNGDAQVSAAEIKEYLASEVTYEARRRYSRDQTPQVLGDTQRVLAMVPAGKFKGF